MVLLTVVTSLPRLTKVSKPIALIAENLETYSVAIIFLAMRLAPMFSDRGPDEVAMEASLVVAGISWRESSRRPAVGHRFGAQHYCDQHG